ncbi:MAG: hypothetical protein HOQ10_02460 [Frateuria sp.]|nr:hypothetical protein [Frateuria sp.]NUO71562.1 hypothetical protein [Frateuria sp.]NUR22664.1 hypothetical protein [Frateuria sp.]
MKFETLMLNCLFAACLVLCLGVMSSMLILPAPTALAGAHTSAVAVHAVG